MTTSVNTNVGAMIALQNLNRTNMQLQETQNRVNTGLKVASAKDDGGIYAIAQRMRADIAGYVVVSNSIDRGESTASVALAAAETISDLLIEMKEKALAASDTSLDAQSRSSLNVDFKALRDQINNVVTNASFNGVNLIDGSTNQIEVLADPNANNRLTVVAEDMSYGGAVITIAATASFGTAAVASAIVSQLTQSLDLTNQALARLGTAVKSLEIQNVFVSKIRDALEEGVGNLVDADLAKESARLQQLQVKQQLGVQALGIANQSPQILLNFFQ